MNIKSISRIVFISLISLILIVSGIGFSYAATTSELKNQESAIDQKIDQLNSEIAGKKNQMTTALNQINKLNSNRKEVKKKIKKEKNNNK